jgi:CubicO group peptidase (beta-lactamase class C family)
MANELLPLHPHPEGVAWPELVWPYGPLGDEVDDIAVEQAIGRLFDGKQKATLGETQAFVIVHGGRVVAEHYAAGVSAATTLTSWSMAKSMLHASVGMLVGQGKLELDAAADVPEWTDVDDPRHAITLLNLLEFRDGLDWVEEYIEGVDSDVLPMLFGDGLADTAAFAATKQPAHPPGEFFNYSSGTSNIVSRIVRDTVGSGEDYRRWLQDQLFGPIGMATATPKFDDAGTWMASSYVFATARDFARFGYLYLRDGMWAGKRILPEGWVDTARTETGRDDDGRIQGRHWWLWGDNPWGAFHCSGYEGQYIVVVPALDLVVVRLGRTPTALRHNVIGVVTDAIAAFDQAS